LLAAHDEGQLHKTHDAVDSHENRRGKQALDHAHDQLQKLDVDLLLPVLQSLEIVQGLRDPLQVSVVPASEASSMEQS
jgi:hypothetical protein